MNFYHRLFLTIGLALVFANTPLMAAEEKENKRIDTTGEKTPVTEWIKAEKALTDSLPLANRETMYIIRHKHGIIRTIEVVHGEINQAVTSCAKENPDIKKSITDRFDTWEKSVLPLIKTAEKNLNKEIKTQDAVHESDLKHVLKLNDKAYDYRNAQIEKTPITDMKSCQKLLRSLDKTEDELVSLLQQSLLPEEVLRSKSKNAVKEQEKAAKKNKAKSE